MALEDEGYKINVSFNGLEAIESVKSSPPDIILMDIQMPKMNGYQACEEIKKLKEYRLIPVIFISAMHVIFNKQKAFEVGAVDYIQKPFLLDEVKIRIKTHIKLYHYQRELENLNIKLLRMFRCAFEQSSVAIIHIDIKTGEILRANKYFAQLFGYSTNEINIMNFLNIIHPDNHQKFKRFITQKIENIQHSQSCECLCQKKDQTEIWIKSTLTMIRDDIGNPDFYQLVIEDITQQKQNIKLIEKKTNELRKTINEKEVLIKELYHRTKNNMQVIASIIHLKAASYPKTTTYSILQDIEAKIYSMSLVHKLLYKSENLSYINMDEYITKLINLFQTIQNDDVIKIDFHYSVQDFDVIIDTALPIGLILSELMSNSLTHGFPLKESGNIYINIRKSEEIIYCDYQDDGTGFPDDFDFTTNESIGLLIVKNLVREQLLGEIKQIKSQKGVNYSMVFKTQMFQPRV